VALLIRGRCPTKSIAVGIAVAGLVVLEGCTRERDELDQEVKQLCAVDGGVKVYETVSVPADYFDEYGVARFPGATPLQPYGQDYRRNWEIKYYRKGDPEMVRSHLSIVRLKDGKVLGEAIRYSRVGGDIPSWLHPSHFSCPAGAGSSDLERQVFIRRKD